MAKDNIKELTIGDKKITLIGTAHVSRESAIEVQEAIEVIQPDNVCIELDSERYASMTNERAWQESDIIDVIKQKRTTMLLINLILSTYQKRIANNFGIESGAEMRAAIKAGDEIGAKLTLADRNLKTTFQRILKKMSLIEKAKLMSGVIISAFDDEEEEDMTEEDLESLKEGDFIENALLEVGAEFPDLKKYLVDERDMYLAHKIKNADGENIVAVLGAAHLAGVEENIYKDYDIDELDEIPKSANIGKIIAIAIPVVIIAMILFTFLNNSDVGLEQLKEWVLYNSTFAAIGALIGGGHIFAILAAGVMAPITSLNPLLAAGWFAGLAQAYISKPKVSDFENLSEDLSTISGFWRNKITRILLVTTFANIGSTFGTFAAGIGIFTKFAELFFK